MGKNNNQQLRFILIAQQQLLLQRTQYNIERKIKIEYHFVREVENKGKVSLLHCHIEDSLADIFTKSLSKI